MTVKVVWHIVKESPRLIGVAAVTMRWDNAVQIYTPS